MSRSVILICGSRALCDTPAAEEWARVIISDLVFAMPDGSAVVTGDARGPDAWALYYAESTLLDLRRVSYALDGARYVDGAFSNLWAQKDDTRAADRQTWPLVRNCALAHDAGVRRREGTLVAGAAFVAPWSKRRGTMHTVNKLRAEGVYVETFVCPREFGPREERL